VKKIIAFSLWGSDEKYTVGALKNADLALKIYPDWVCRYYIGRSTPFHVIKDLCSRSNTEIFLMAEEGDWTAMFWRFYCASDYTVDVMISRDTDSRLNMREQEAVSEWLQSDKGFHIMRDHPFHTTEILGGMWGIKKNVLPQMQKLICDYTKGDFWQVDQNFLKEKVYPLIKDTTYVHDPFFEKKPFPTQRPPGMFVGQAHNADDSLFEPKHSLILQGIHNEDIDYSRKRSSFTK